MAEDILTPLGIPTPYVTDGGNLTLEFTIQAADVRGAAQVFSSSFAFGVYPLQEIPLVSVGTPAGLVANFMNGNNGAFNSRVYLWNPSESSGDVTVRVFTLPLTGGLAQELTTAPLNLGTLGAKSALNVKLVENILAPLGITLPYTTDGGNLTLEFTIQAADVRGTAQVFSSSFAFGTYPLQNVELITDGGDVPPTPLAPADEAAFNTLSVGKRAVTNYPTFYVDFVSPGRFRETEGSETSTGSYTYRNTGSNTGTLTLNYDDGDRCTVSLTFDSTTAGTASYTCNDGSSGEYNWQLVETPQLQVTMSASPTSIERGQSATLRWSSTNAVSATITPGIGTVQTSGSRSVSPTSTTTYRITVRDADRQTASGTATVAVTDKPFNQLQTERLIGTWVFSYRISSSEFTSTYTLSDVVESSITPGEWHIFGTDEFDDLVIAGYSPLLGMFSLLDKSITIDRFFTFDFIGSNTVSGCYYQIDVEDDSFSSCYDMTGVRTSSTALTSRTSARAATTEAHAELGEIEEAKKLGIEMQIEVDPKIIRVLEDLREVLRQ